MRSIVRDMCAHKIKSAALTHKDTDGCSCVAKKCNETNLSCFTEQEHRVISSEPSHHHVCSLRQCFSVFFWSNKVEVLNEI